MRENVVGLKLQQSRWKKPPLSFYCYNLALNQRKFLLDEIEFLLSTFVNVKKKLIGKLLVREAYIELSEAIKFI